MKNISEIRFLNARHLASQFESNAEFARLLGMSDSYMWQILGDAQVRKIGNKIARRMELACDKPEGWMDTNQSLESSTDKASPNKKAANPKISDDALRVAKAFDLLNNAAQREAVLSQLRAFGVL